MKNSKYTLRTFISMVVLVTGVFSCAEEFTEPESPSGTSITDAVKASADFDILEAALIKTGLATSFDNTNSGSYTVFAPSDAAFLAYLQSSAVYNNGGLTEAQAILNIQNLTNTSAPLSISQLSTRLNYHTVSSEITTDMITGANGFNTLNGARLSLSKQGATILLNANTNSITAAGNGATVTLTDGTPVNGIIHVIDRFLVPVTTANLLTSIGITGVSYTTNPATITPSLTTLETSGDATGTDYDILAYAIVRANLAIVLQPNASPLPDFTLFAPTDNAFRAHLGDVAAVTKPLEDAAIATLKAMDPAALADMLKYHIVTGRVLSTDLTDEQVVTTLLTGKTFTVNIDAGIYTLKDNRDADALNDPTITTANTLTNAGVRHTVNTVLRSVPD